MDSRSKRKNEHVIHNFDLSGLSLEQRNSAREMLLEESESFSCDDGDIGYVPKLNSVKYQRFVLYVRKKDETLRLCVDHRELNRLTIPDRHPIPLVQETLDNLGGNSLFSV